jgi:hypothetical protein
MQAAKMDFSSLSCKIDGVESTLVASKLDARHEFLCCALE